MAVCDVQVLMRLTIHQIQREKESPWSSLCGLVRALILSCLLPLWLIACHLPQTVTNQVNLCPWFSYKVCEMFDAWHFGVNHSVLGSFFRIYLMVIPTTLLCCVETYFIEMYFFNNSRITAIIVQLEIISRY